MRTEIVMACAAMTAVTFLCRSFLTISVSRIQVTPRTERFLSVIPFAALTALVTPYLSTGGSSEILDLVNPYLVAGIPTLLIASRSRNLILSVAVGMGIYLLLGVAGFS